MLALLGFQLQSCSKEENGGADEYGCPYVTFHANGTVTDENGNKIDDAEVKIEQKLTRGSYVLGTTKSNDIGEFSINTTPSMAEQMNFDIITNKSGYKPDTISLESHIEEFKGGKGWNEGNLKKEFDIKLKK